jgi:putative ABC transport system permease protein
MVRHILIAAWRNMMANRLISAIAILGLSVGIAAALLMALVVRNQMSFDHFIPGHARIFMMVNDDIISKGQPIPCLCDTLDHDAAAFFGSRIPEIQDSTRLYLTGAGGPHEITPTVLRHGIVTAEEVIYWADPNVFDLLPLPVLHGDLATALRRPDSIVLPKATAEKYFGRDDVLGQVISVDGHPMVVRAVIRDLPHQGTTLQSGIFASSLSPWSKLLPPGAGVADATARNTYLLAIVYWRLRPGADIAALDKRVSALMTARSENITRSFRLLPLDRLNLFEKFNPGIRARLVMAAAIGAAVLLIAMLNFVSLMTVIAARREREIGVRKACGAGRTALIGQFLGEAMIAVALGAGIALALDEWLLPPLNAFLQTGARLDYGGESLLLPALLLVLAGLGLAAGAYPAFLLSGFRPAATLRGNAASGEGTQIMRRLLVGAQFAILVALGICTLVFWQQHRFATRQAMRADTDQVLLLRFMAPEVPDPRPIWRRLVKSMTDPRACPAGLVDGLRRVPGVRMAVCSFDFLQHEQPTPIDWYVSAHTLASASIIQADPAIFSFYGIKAVAGSLAKAGSGVVLNEAAAKLLGFSSPQEAIGKTWMKPKSARDLYRNSRTGMPGPDNPHSFVAAVVPDFGFQPVSQPIEPYIISPWMNGYTQRLIQIKLDGGRIPETLAAIDRVWRQTGHAGTPDRIFLNDYMQQQYIDLEREAQLFTLVSGIAIFMACLGLFGIAVSTAERRTKEIGVRKAMGATTARIVALLLWQFAQPVLWANIIAWPVAWWLMRRWLSGFAYHVDLHWWVFVAASGAALLIALATVAGQAFLTARAKPVLALRYE